MLMTNRWLAGPSPTRRLDRDRLEERVLNLLSSQNMCVLATVGSDGPLATPVRYFHLDFTVVFTAAATSPRMRNHAADARCRSPCTPRWSVRPEAEVRSCSAVPDPDFATYCRWCVAVRSRRAVAGRSEPPVGTIGMVPADRIVYTKHWLRREGYAPRQCWRRDPAGTRAELRSRRACCRVRPVRDAVRPDC